MVWFLGSKIRKAAQTSHIEEKRAQLKKDYQEFEAFSNSEELTRYNELKSYVDSSEFKARKKEVEALRYKGSSEWKREREYLKYQKSGKYRTYLKVKDSSELKAFELMKNSSELEGFGQLKKLVCGAGFNKKENKQEWKDYKTLKKSAKIKDFLKFKKSKRYSIYKSLEGSDELKNHYLLEEYLKSDEFCNKKEFLLDRKRFLTTAEYKKYIECKQLEESQSFQKYFEWKRSDPFKELKEWELTFSDDFESSQLDRDKWITKYYWGDVFLNESYSLPHELHYFTDGNNISIKDSVAVIETRHENVTGKVWDTSMGFVTRDFEYTSGLISTGKSFRQKYGRFEAKIRVKNLKDVNHSFWMLSEKSLPHIDVIKTTSDRKVTVGNLWNSGKEVKSGVSKLKGIDLTSDFFIYSLEWTSQKLVWRINDVVVKVQKKGVPNQPMYVLFSSGLNVQANGTLPSCMEIDWVCCYKKKE